MSPREQRALAQRQANEQAHARGEPLPFPNPFDGLDPTKVGEGASREDLLHSYSAFAAICRPIPCRRHVL